MTTPVSAVWVIGLGGTGSALAAALAANGVRVTGVERGTAELRRGAALVRERVEDLLAGTGRAPDEALALFDGTTGTALAPAADLVVEAVPEDLDVKACVLRDARARCGPATAFATTTTGLPVTEIAARAGLMTRTVGLHLGDPGRWGRAGVVEVVSTPVTDPAVLDGVLGLVRGLNCAPVPVVDRPGFVGGRLVMAYLNRAAAMCGEGYATRDDIDAAMTLGCGLPQGPLRHLDELGLDVAHDTLTALHRRTGDPAYAPAPILTAMVSDGLLGRKSGRGFYSYADRPAADRPAVEPLAADRPAAEPPAANRPAADRSAAEPLAAAPLAAAPADPPAPGRALRRIGLVGAGAMAAGIAECCARAGFDTVVVARSELRAKEARAAVERSLFRAVRRGRLDRAEAEAAVGRLVTSARFDDLGDCDLVIEAVTESPEAKREVFRRLDQVARPGAVLASTTSSLSVLDCALATGRPQDVVGLHFFNPAPVMKLVEVARTFLTAADVVATAHALGGALGKRTIDCADRAGFIVNYLLLPYLNQAAGLLDGGRAAIEDVDRVMTGGYGYPLGPFQLLDLIGLDVSLATYRRLRAAFGDSLPEPAAPLVELTAAGHLGRKSGRGFHVHPNGEGNG